MLRFSIGLSIGHPHSLSDHDIEAVIETDKDNGIDCFGNQHTVYESVFLREIRCQYNT